MKDTVHAFTPHAPLRDYGSAPAGALSNLSFAVKDLFDVAGLVTGAGNPTWAEGRAPAARDAPVVAALRAAGARFVGKTITDELAWSLGGENIHYGVPLNEAAPGRVTGGSSSGSAAAVAAGLVDFALGTDTGGSVRLPASFTGLWGIRTTHGAIATDGVVPLAPSFDTIGWFARDAATLARVGVQVLPTPDAQPAFDRVLIASDLFDRLDCPQGAALRAQAGAVAEWIGLPVETIQLAPGGVAPWREAFRICQAAEAWSCHGRWVATSGAALGPDIAERFRMAATLTPDEIATARTARATIARALHGLLAGGALLLVPGAGGLAPLRGQTSPDLAAARAAALDMLCPASLAGLPQLAVPALRTGAGPLGLGLVAARGRDRGLLALAARLTLSPRPIDALGVRG